MNIKMATHHNYQQMNLKNNKLSKQPELEQNHRHGDHLEVMSQERGEEE